MLNVFLGLKSSLVDSSLGLWLELTLLVGFQLKQKKKIYIHFNFCSRPVSRRAAFCLRWVWEGVPSPSLREELVFRRALHH